MNRLIIQKSFLLIVITGLLIGVSPTFGANPEEILPPPQIASKKSLGEPPVAIIAAPANNSAPDKEDILLFDAQPSYDPDGGPITVLWEVEPLPDRWRVPESRIAFPTRIVPDGDYKIILTVTDEEGLTDTAVIYLTVTEKYASITEATTSEITTTSSIQATDTAATSATTIETRTTEVKTIDPIKTFIPARLLPGFSPLSAFFALLIATALLKRKIAKK